MYYSTGLTSASACCSRSRRTNEAADDRRDLAGLGWQRNLAGDLRGDIIRSFPVGLRAAAVRVVSAPDGDARSGDLARGGIRISSSSNEHALAVGWRIHRRLLRRDFRTRHDGW